MVMVGSREKGSSRPSQCQGRSFELALLILDCRLALDFNDPFLEPPTLLQHFMSRWDCRFRFGNIVVFRHPMRLVENGFAARIS